MTSTQRMNGKSSRENYPLLQKKAAALISDLVLLERANIGVFRRNWNQLYRRYSDLMLLEIANELRLLWWHAAPSRPPFSRIENLFKHTAGTEQLENDYENSGAPERKIALPQFICERWLQREKNGIVISCRSGQVRANPSCLPTVLAVTSLNNRLYLRICMNKDCANRYFIAARKDQRYCSPECAEPSRLAAKLKWWHANRGSESVPKERSKNVTHKAR